MCVRLASHLGSILRGRNHDRCGKSWGGVGAGRCTVCPFSAPPYPPHRSLRTNISPVEGPPAFSTRRPGPSAETRGAPSRGREPPATCSHGPPSARGCSAASSARCRCGSPRGCVTFPRTPSQLGGRRRPQGLQAGDRAPAQPAPTPPSGAALPAAQAVSAQLAAPSPLARDEHTRWRSAAPAPSFLPPRPARSSPRTGPSAPGIKRPGPPPSSETCSRAPSSARPAQGPLCTRRRRRRSRGRGGALLRALRSGPRYSPTSLRRHTASGAGHGPWPSSVQGAREAGVLGPESPAGGWGEVAGPAAARVWKSAAALGGAASV